MISLCPHCHKGDFTYLNLRLYGWAQEYYDMNGLYCELDLQGMHSSSSKTVRCANCGKVRRDLVFEDGAIRAREGT
jgi:hypothetical protein